MQAIELETQIDQNGQILLPEKFQHLFGKSARVLLLLTDENVDPEKKRQPGSAKGILTIVDEDDLHLDDFKAYMS